jgi:hypothetical protein
MIGRRVERRGVSRTWRLASVCLPLYGDSATPAGAGLYVWRLASQAPTLVYVTAGTPRGKRLPRRLVTRAPLLPRRGAPSFFAAYRSPGLSRRPSDHQIRAVGRAPAMQILRLRTTTVGDFTRSGGSSVFLWTRYSVEPTRAPYHRRPIFFPRTGLSAVALVLVFGFPGAEVRCAGQMLSFTFHGCG